MSQEQQTKRHCKKHQNNELLQGLLVMGIYYVCNKLLRKCQNSTLNFRYFHSSVRSNTFFTAYWLLNFMALSLTKLYYGLTDLEYDSKVMQGVYEGENLTKTMSILAFWANFWSSQIQKSFSQTQKIEDWIFQFNFQFKKNVAAKC